MAISQFPADSGPKAYPFGSASLYTLPSTIGAGVYKVNVSGSQSFAASLNALTLRTSAGYEIPVAFNQAEGYVTCPVEANAMRVASLSVPTVIELDRIRYDVVQAPTFVGASLVYTSASYVINVTVPAGTQQTYLYNINGTRQALGTTFPASITSPVYDPRTGSASVFNFVLTTVDAYGVESLGTVASVSVPTPPAAYATGGTEYTSGGYRYHKFTSNGTLTVTYPGPLEYMVCAGGGGGGDGENNAAGGGGGGGGAGGLVSGSANVVIQNYTITVGGGGAGTSTTSAAGSPGNASSFGTTASAAGGGAGAGDETGGGNGGSGGGRGGDSAIGPGTGIAGQGNNGGSNATSGYRAGGGGGGKNEVGNTDGQGHGGDGTNSFSTWATATSSGASGFFAGGGGGGRYATPGAPGGDGGGGRGGISGGDQNGVAGTVNTGGGGGGASSGYSGAGAAGGSGIVLIRYII
jgi:hypothetical protein